MASAVQISLIFGIVVLFAVFNFGTALNCIHCTGDCKTNTSTPCTGDNDQCLKIEDGKGDKLVQKGCGTTAMCDMYKYCYACKDKADCNSSSSVTPSFILMGILTAVAAKRYIF